MSNMVCIVLELSEDTEKHGKHKEHKENGTKLGCRLVQSGAWQHLETESVRRAYSIDKDYLQPPSNPQPPNHIEQW